MSGSSLPDDLRREQALRLQAFHVAGTGLWVLTLVMDHVAPDGGGGAHRVAIEATGAAVAAASALFLRLGRATVRARIEVGVGTVVLLALLVGLLNSWSGVSESPRPLSANVVLILFFGMLSPASPGRVLAVGALSAAMDPLALYVAGLRGLPAPDAFSSALLFYPNFVCAGLAVAPSRLLYRLGREIREARAIGSYALVARLGVGGMGEVWLARHRLLATPAAIKLIRPNGAGAADPAHLRTRFEREARATATLSSPNTVRLFDYGVAEDGTFYYVSEYLRGLDLERLVTQFGPMPVPRALHVVEQMCRSLAEAHAIGLVHRDVKPANVYLCRLGVDSDVVKVLDFGLVREERRSSDQTLLTGALAVIGTPAYMAPEAVSGSEAVGRRADVYAIGCVTYFLLTGRLVFDANTPLRMLMQHANEPPTPPSARSELGIPPEVDAFVLSCLEKDPDRRPSDAAALLERIEAMPDAIRGSWTRRNACEWWDAHVPVVETERGDLYEHAT